jgi:16S rRNA (uracil1498-N3)-methyltransferase
VTAPHFFVDPNEYPVLTAGGTVFLSTVDSHHALRSLRLHPRDALTVATGTGWLGTGRLLGERSGRAEIEIDHVQALRPPRPRVRVAIAPPKGDRLSWAVQKLSEVGVDGVTLIRTERTVRRPVDGSRKLLERMAVVAREAAMQSRRPFLMTLDDQDPFTPGLWTAELKLLLWEGANRRLAEAIPPDVTSVALAVGPEGSFTDSEVATARAAGFVDVSLGPGILRTETAAIVGAALVLARYRRLG